MRNINICTETVSLWDANHVSLHYATVMWGLGVITPIGFALLGTLQNITQMCDIDYLSLYDIQWNLYSDTAEVLL